MIPSGVGFGVLEPQVGCGERAAPVSGRVAPSGVGRIGAFAWWALGSTIPVRFRGHAFNRLKHHSPYPARV